MNPQPFDPKSNALSIELQAHHPNYSTSVNYAGRNGLQLTQEIKHDSVELLRFFHIWHVMGFGYRNALGASNILFEFVCVLKQARIIFGA